MKALNIYGWSQYSDVSTVIAAEVPSEPNIPTTTASGKNVVIAFEKPFTNGEDIVSYTILIKQADGIFSSQKTYCDGSTTIVKESLKCTIPFTVLRSSPFNLAF